MVGMRVVAIANRTLETAERAFADAGVDALRERARPGGPGRRSLDRGGRAVTDDPLLLCRAPGHRGDHRVHRRVELGARVAIEAIANGKHVMLMNAEVDATVGPILKVLADRAGVVSPTPTATSPAWR